MSTAKQIYEKSQRLTQPAQKALLQIVELLADQFSAAKNSPPKAGNAKALIEIGSDFEEPLEDFRPYLA